jgi:ribosomal protein L7/L12
LKYILSFSCRSYTFSTLADANEARAVVRVLNPDIYTGIQNVAEPLNGWTADAGDMFALEQMVNTNKINCIKYARMKSGSGLKEAKDWVEANFFN